MASSPPTQWADRPIVRLNREDPYLRVQNIMIFVHDLDRSLRFYLDQLGFSLAFDVRLQSGDRWVAVAPPDGTATLALVTPNADSEEYKLIGRFTRVVFVTEDVNAKFEEWRKRGVRFEQPPQTPAWGGTFTRFQDVDGNTFVLVGFDEVTQEVEAQRRSLAEWMEAERRAARELEIAKQVQARLFPQTAPPLKTLDYAGLCIQAQQVGGDYYDFLNLGAERLGLVIGDISGKGIAAALLMANLQANLRSQCVMASDQPQSFLRSVNQLFFENTTESAYASLFYADYDDKMRRLRYANCGHLSALLLRNDTLERLNSTCTLLGLFKEWDCVIEECQLCSEDILVLYTDGVTESFNEAGEEFGEQRLIESLRRHRKLPSHALLRSIIHDVQQFGPPEQHDDITLIVARCRAD